jgi:hypothetical protein
MTTECNIREFAFQGLGSRAVTARFDGGAITSDAGSLLLREVEAKTGILRQFAACFTDHRDPERVEHSVAELLAQRVFALALGYEDLNDHDTLRHDPLLAVLVGKADPTGQERRRRKDRGKSLVGKAEHLAKGSNPRFIVTSLPSEEFESRALYEDLYCARGEMENRIKEQQLCLFADRTSCATMRANQLRLWLSSAAYTLLAALRQFGLQGTEMAQARCDTIRLKLLKLGALVRTTVRRVWISLSESCPYQRVFAQVYENLKQWSPPAPLPASG